VMLSSGFGVCVGEEYAGLQNGTLKP